MLRLLPRELPPIPAVFAAMKTADLKRLDGCVVLVKSIVDHQHKPRTGVRGFIEVREGIAGEPSVHIAYDLPQMFGRTARHYTIPLGPAEIDRLLASETNGSYEYTLPTPIDPTPGYEAD